MDSRKVEDVVLTPTHRPLARERLVLQSAWDFNDEFFAAYLTSMRFYWPDSFGSAFKYDRKNAQYRLKDDVHSSLGDLNHWRTNDDLISRFPDLEDDVNLVSTLPAFILLWRGPVPDREDKRESKRHRRMSPKPLTPSAQQELGRPAAMATEGLNVSQPRQMRV